MATNDIHYIEREDARPHDVLLCIQQQKVQSDTARLKFDTDEFYLKSPQEMRALFSQWPEACDATLAIAESVDLTMEFGTLHLPRFDPPDGMSLDAYLSRLVYEGAKERYGDVSAEIRARVDQELSVIGRMGFAGYFLIVWDLIRFARERGIRVGPGRGSAAGSVVSYCLRITDLDPLRYGLIFERFLNPERKQMPDIDMDFDVRGRDQVIQYVARPVRRRPRRADHHVPDDQGEAGDPGRGESSGLPRLDGRPALQDVPAGGPRTGVLDRGRAEAVARAPRRLRDQNRRRARWWTRPARWRGSGARTRSTRPESSSATCRW